MTFKQQIVKRQLLKELGILRQKRDRLITQIKGLKKYKEALHELPRRKIKTRSPNRASGPETKASISIIS